MEDRLAIDVSRETTQKLELFAELILKWTPKINLIAPQSAEDIWNRHIVDSVQIYDHAPENWKNWIDLGSGGGLPGIVVAILDQRQRMVTLVESDTRKATFLRAARRELDLNLDVINDRIERQGQKKFDVVSARALASLDVLLGYASSLLSSDGLALLPKGRTYNDELVVAQKNWDFELRQLPSITSSDSRILRVQRIKKREF